MLGRLRLRLLFVVGRLPLLLDEERGRQLRRPAAPGFDAAHSIRAKL
jgi:hypothetical protein